MPVDVSYSRWRLETVIIIWLQGCLMSIFMDDSVVSEWLLRIVNYFAHRLTWKIQHARCHFHLSIGHLHRNMLVIGWKEITWFIFAVSLTNSNFFYQTVIINTYHDKAKRKKCCVMLAASRRAFGAKSVAFAECACVIILSLHGNAFSSVDKISISERRRSGSILFQW